MIGIVDYGVGNVFSIEKKMKLLNLDYVISHDPEELYNCNRLILPGVGHFKTAMDNIKAKGLLPVLRKCVLDNKKPVLGICLGMQIMTTHSEEGNCEGLGWINATTHRFNHSRKDFQTPHCGWNTVDNTDGHLFEGMRTNSEFYFVHCYYVKSVSTDLIKNYSKYDVDFVSAFQKNNIFGVQFHPEKSHDAGIKVLQNFLSYV